jgi:putative transcriptional regulator
MNEKLFEELLESVEQHEEIRRGERAPSRVFQVDATGVKEIRAATGLSQRKSLRDSSGPS